VGVAPPRRVLGPLDGATPTDDASGIDAVAQQGQQRRQQGERSGYCEQHDQRRPEADGDEDAHSGEDQSQHRHDHGAAGHRDSRSSWAHGSGEGRGVVLTGGAVLAVAGGDEQRVVDAHAEPDHRADRRCGGRDVHRAGQQEDAAQTGGNSDQRERDGYQCGHDRAERDDQHDQGRQQADRFGAGGLALCVDERGVAA
jgi:hypothetical protein